MTTIALINQKGGTAKTTTAANLGGALASLGKKILLIDFDPQANLTFSFGIQPSANGTVAEVIQSKKPLQSILVERNGLFLAPSSIILSDIEVSLVNKIGRERILKECLRDLQGFDFIFIDCPPAISVLTVNALTAADEVLIPLQMEILSMQGLDQLLDTIRQVKHVLNQDLKIAGIIPSMYDSRRRLSEEVLKEIQAKIQEPIFKTRIRECVKIAEAPSFAQTVLTYAPHSNGAEDFRNLAKEFLERRETQNANRYEYSTQGPVN